MNTDNEYYTPSIEEFHPGFEYEFLEDIREVDPSQKPAHKFHVFMKKVGERWVKDIVRTEDSLEKYDELIRFKCVRVKRLSHECILECGWEVVKSKNQYGTRFYITGRRSPYVIRITNGGHVLIVRNQYDQDGKYESDEAVFEGKLQNINELRTIMKQVGI